MEKSLNNIGCALITCDRIDFFQKSYSSLKAICEKLNIEYVVVNDGIESVDVDTEHCIKTGGKKGVAVAKNLGIKFLLDKNIEHVFLMEDDVEILDANVFNMYIDGCKSTGIKHFNFGMHGNHNKDQNGNPLIRKTVNFPNDFKIDLYPNLLGAFSYYHKDCFDKVGLMDESYYNAMEHVDHTYQCIQHNLHPPFRWFADIHGSSSLLKDIVPDHQQSKIRNDSDFQKNFKNGLDKFIDKNKFSVVQGYGPPEKFFTEEECLNVLKEIWKNNQQKK